MEAGLLADGFLEAVVVVVAGSPAPARVVVGLFVACLRGVIGGG